MIYAAAKTATTTVGSPLAFVLFGVAVAVIVVIMIIARRQKKQIREDGVQVPARIVASRILMSVNGGLVPYGFGMGYVRGQVVDHGNGVRSGSVSGVGVGEDGVTFGSARGISWGTQFAHADNVDVTLSIEYTDPVSGKSHIVQQPTNLGVAKARLPQESFEYTETYVNDAISGINAIGGGIAAIREAAQESARLRAEGYTPAEISTKMTHDRDQNQTGFTRLHEPIPVKLWINDSPTQGRQFSFDWV